MGKNILSCDGSREISSSTFRYAVHGKGGSYVTCKYDLDETIIVMEHGEYYEMTGVIVSRRPGTVIGLPTIFGGNTTCYYTIKLSNGKKRTFSESSIRPR